LIQRTWISTEDHYKST